MDLEAQRVKGGNTDLGTGQMMVVSIRYYKIFNAVFNICDDICFIGRLVAVYI